MKTQTHTLPAHWASYLVNGDGSGLDFYELAYCNAWLDLHPELSGCISCSDEPFFARVNDANALAGDCLEYTFQRMVTL